MRKSVIPILWAALLATLLFEQTGRSGPPETLNLEGLRNPARVQRDVRGVPYIFAQQDHDLYFLQGYLQAEDRLFQMDTLRKTFSGRLSELLGAAALGSDVQFRSLGLDRAAQRSLSLLSGETLDALEAYADGVNAYVASHPLPEEYGVLELTQFYPWFPIDSVLIAKGFAFGLSFDLADLDRTTTLLRFVAEGQLQNFDGAALFSEDLYRVAPFDPSVTSPAIARSAAEISPTSLGNQLPNFFRASTLRLARDYLDQIKEIPILQNTFHSRRDFGSNAWVVAGALSQDGHPLIANDPHLALDTPPTFYQNNLSVSADPVHGPMNANGVTLAGVPGLFLGCNETSCWGTASSPLDVTDVFQEGLVLDPQSGLPTHTRFEDSAEAVVQIPQTFMANQIGDQVNDNLVAADIAPESGGVTIVVPRRNHGPLISVDPADPPTGLSVQYTGWSGTRELDGYRALLRAGSVEHFQEALQYIDTGSQNFVYADRSGTIAFFTSSEVPLREDLQNLGFPEGGVPPSLIRDGTHTLHHEWLGVENRQPGQAIPYEILSFSEMPQSINPASGYLITANNDPWGDHLDNDPLNQLRAGGNALYYLSSGYDLGLRSGRLERRFEELLQDSGKLSFQDMQDLQADNRLLDAEVLLPFLFDAFDAAQEEVNEILFGLAHDEGIVQAVSRLRDWDFSTPTGVAGGYDPGDDPESLPVPSQAEIDASVAATLYSVWRGQLVAGVIDSALSRLGLQGLAPGSADSLKAVRNLLDRFEDNQGFGASGVNFFDIPERDELESQSAARDVVLLQSLRKTLDLLASEDFAGAFSNSTQQEDYRWGRLHRITLDHVLGGAFNIPPGGGFEDLDSGLPGLARAGGFGSVDAANHSVRARRTSQFLFGSGASWRMVGSLDPTGTKAIQVIPGGESAKSSSTHYTDQLGAWLTNHYVPLVLDPGEIPLESTQDYQPSTLHFFFPTYPTDDPQVFTGFAVYNRAPDPLTLAFRTRDSEGALRALPQNPRMFMLESSAQLSQLGTDIFGIPDAPVPNGWVDLAAVPGGILPQIGPSMASFTLVGSLDLSRMDGGIAQASPLHELVFTRVFEGAGAFRGEDASTRIFLANPGSVPASVVLQLVLPQPMEASSKAAGTLPETEVTRDIPQGGVLEASVAQLFELSDPVSEGYLRVRVTSGDGGVVGFESIQINGRTLIGLNPVAGNGLGQAFSAQFATAATLFTNLKLVNTADFERTLEIRLSGSDGSPAADPIPLILAPGEVFVEDASQLLGSEPAGGQPAIEGSLSLSASGGGIVGDVIFGDPFEANFAAGLTLQSRTFSKAIFSHVANATGFFTGLAFYFPGNSGTAQISVQVFDSSGSATGSTQLELEAGARRTGLLAELVPETASQAGGFIIVSSSQPIVAQQLFGTGTLSLLAAVPPTIVQ